MLQRRELLKRSGLGFGALALGSLMSQLGMSAPTTTSTSPLDAKPPHYPGKAKQIIHIFLNGGCSHIDSFDPKPLLEKYAGKPIPVHKPTERKTGAAFPSPFKFQKYGESGIEVSELFPHVGKVIDNFCVVRSMHADVPNHEPSLLLMNCGEPRLVRPSMGSWVTYGLGTENQNLPAFLAMCPGGYPIQETQNWQAGFLPGIFQGTYVDTQHSDIEKLIENIRTKHQSLEEQRAQLNLVQKLNRLHQQERPGDAQLDARIQSFELAARMQVEAADVFDVNKETKETLERYGSSKQGRQLLIARRLIEHGVRFVQLWHGNGQPWDNHDDLEVNHRKLAKECDQGIGALISDLKERGLLDTTLVMISGEFGRTPTVELPTPGSNAGKINGRDHNHYGFTMLLAGGGIKAGHIHGATDEFGFAAVENKVHVHDLHATIMHLLGFDHEKFTYRYAGRDFRLTDVHGKVVREICA
jgi:hypothetical protein